MNQPVTPNGSVHSINPAPNGIKGNPKADAFRLQMDQCIKEIVEVTHEIGGYMIQKAACDDAIQDCITRATKLGKRKLAIHEQMKKELG